MVVKPPWEIKVNPEDSPDVQRRKVEQIVVEKKKWSRSGKWGNWEKGRRKALRERRDYFKEHPDKKDDYSGV